MKMKVVHDFYHAGEVIEDMLNEGYELNSISVNGEVFRGKIIKNIDFMRYVCIEFVYGRILFIPYEKIDFIGLDEVEEELL